MSSKMINNVNPTQFKILSSRMAQFHINMNDPTKQVVNVFDPLSKKQLEELDLIRGVTGELQKKKHEDMMKAAAQAGEHELATREEKEPKAAEQKFE